MYQINLTIYCNCEIVDRNSILYYFYIQYKTSPSTQPLKLTQKIIKILFMWQYKYIINTMCCSKFITTSLFRNKLQFENMKAIPEINLTKLVFLYSIKSFIFDEKKYF